MKIAIVGPSNKFTSGISYFTISLANALSEKYSINAILLRDLLPQFLFPGSKRVGKKISNFEFNDKVKVYNGVDWYWFPSLFLSGKYFNKSDYIILQWWTSATAHTYLAIKLMNKLFWKKKIIIEFHEVLDPLENSILPLRLYVKMISRLLFKNNYAYVTHSENDKRLLLEKYKLSPERFSIVSHGSYDNFFEKVNVEKDTTKCNILFFGLLRPYKGVEYLIESFKKLDKSKFSLTIAGELFEKYDLASKVTSDIRFIQRYLTDKEVTEEFNRADVLVLPYIRASQSGAAHIAVSYGLPVIVTPVGGLKESMVKYDGAIFVKPENVNSIILALNKIYPLRHKRYNNPHPWSKTVEQYETVLV